MEKALAVGLGGVIFFLVTLALVNHDNASVSAPSLQNDISSNPLVVNCPMGV